MSTPTAPDIAAIVREVIAQITTGQVPAVRAALAPAAVAAGGNAHGIFASVNDSVAAAQTAFEHLESLGVEGRRRAIAHIRRIAIEDAEELGSMEFAETKIGRLEHKIEKLKVLGEKVPGVEFMTSEVFSGDHGLAVIEHAPFGRSRTGSPRSPATPST
jgi:aldehyde dehydrogenase